MVITLNKDRLLLILLWLLVVYLFRVAMLKEMIQKFVKQCQNDSMCDYVYFTTADGVDVYFPELSKYLYTEAEK